MLLGCWVLALLPLFSILQRTGVADQIQLPSILPFDKTTNTLGSNFYADWLDPFFTFFIGITLLFAKERFRRRGFIDSIRRVGILVCVGVLFLGIASFGLIVALVGLGISALLHTLPIENQPPETHVLAWVSTRYFDYAPNSTLWASSLLIAFSAAAVLLACVVLFEVLRSTLPMGKGRARRRGMILAALPTLPLAILAVVQLAAAVAVYFQHRTEDHLPYAFFYFEPQSVAVVFQNLPAGRGATVLYYYADIIKWLSCVVIALWLTTAQIASWRHPRPCQST